MNTKERILLRDLAGKVSEVANSTSEISKRESFKRLNALHRVRPPVVLFTPGEVIEHFLPFRESVMIESDPFFRNVEYWLRWRLARRERLPDDLPASDIYHTPIDHTVSGWTDEYHEVRMNADKSGSRFEPCLIDYSDIRKLSKPHLTVNEASTNETYEKVVDAISDIFNIVKGEPFRQTIGWGESMIDQFVELRGLEQSYYDMVDAPEFIHEVMDFMTKAKLDLLEEYREQGMLVMNNEGNYIGSSSLGYTDELKPPLGQLPDVKNLWGFAQAQELQSVSPDMLEEFVLPYQAKIVNRFGLSLYGCCEAIEDKIEVITKYISNVRMISISPYANIQKAAQIIQNRFVFAWKQDPSLITIFDQGAIEEDLRRNLQSSRMCPVAVLIMDAFEFGNDFTRFPKWIEIAKRVASEFD